MNAFMRSYAVALAVLVPAVMARADDTVALQAARARFDRNAAITGAGSAGMRIGGEFSHFAGSAANADRLIAGLRRAGPITLDADSRTAGRNGPAIQFSAPTRPMGYSDIYISLAISRLQLAGFGVIQPTPGEIKAALIGGAVAGAGAGGRSVTLPGVLALRSRGMPWGAVAKSTGVPLATVVSGVENANRDLSLLHAHQLGTAAALAAREHATATTVSAVADVSVQ